VVAGAEEVFVSLYDNRKYKAQVIGNDPKTDLAVIKIKEDNLPVAELGNSDDVKIGEWVLAVGNPFNLNSTVTAGIISAKGRSINAYENGGIESFIQTDAAVNPGNSGGALVNTEGKLIGINAAIASPTGSYTGYSFAIPVNLAKKVVNDLIQYGQVKRGMLGVSIQEVDSRLVSQKKLNVPKGVYVAKVQENGDAYKAGVKEGDVIVKINGMNITSIQELREQVASHNLGDVLKVTVNRNGREKDINVKVKSL
jgi:S1-C subfamily serine protease